MAMMCQSPARREEEKEKVRRIGLDWIGLRPVFSQKDHMQAMCYGLP